MTVSMFFDSYARRLRYSGVALLLSSGLTVAAQPPGSVALYPLDNNSQAMGITPGPDGAMWFTDFALNRIGRVTTNGIISMYSIPTADSQPMGITAGPDGALWFTE